ncbi:MAG TPA: hypothetical protein ENI06_00285 [Spirochaetales bacterium]|nr:hypothetical protein [Spirochaetales bacterium]
MRIERKNRENIPEKLKSFYYFNFTEHNFIHGELFSDKYYGNVIEVIAGIADYCRKWLAEESSSCGRYRSITPPGNSLVHGRFEVFARDEVTFLPSTVIGPANGGPGRLFISKGAQVIGAALFLDRGDIFIGENTTLQPGSCLKGPVIIGAENDIRPGCFFRGDVISGAGCILGCEAKNAVFLDYADFPHPSYVGDSLLGFGTHFGNQVTAANFGIFSSMLPVAKQKNIIVKVDDVKYDTGLKKLGLVLGDYSQVGCSSVTDPGTFLGPRTMVYSLTRLQKGFYGPNQIIKNKPLEKGVLEISPLMNQDQTGAPDVDIDSASPVRRRFNGL